MLSKASGILEAANFSNNYSNLNSSGNYYLGSEILLYEVKDKIQSMNDIKYYPVFLENDIIGVVIARLSSDNEVLLEYIDYLTEELNLIYDSNKETCIVFDKNYAWLYCWACVASSIGQFKKGTVIDPQTLAYEYAGDLYTPKTIQLRHVLDIR